jgi:hypothetical protein
MYFAQQQCMSQHDESGSLPQAFDSAYIHT